MDTFNILIIREINSGSERLQAILAEFGHQICATVTPGDVELKLVDEHQPDLVIVDLLQENHGVEVVIAEKLKGTYQIPLLFLSNSFNKEVLSRISQITPCNALNRSYEKIDLEANLQMMGFTSRMLKQRNLEQKKLQASEARWQTLIENSSDYIFELDYSLRICYFNRPLSFFPKIELQNLSIVELFQEEALASEIEKILKEVLKSGISASFEKDYHQGSEPMSLFLRAVPILLDQELSGRRLILVVRDITRLKYTEQNLREKDKWLGSTFQQAAVGIVYTDLNDTIERVNDKYCQILGYSSTELIGKSLKDLTHSDFYPTQVENREKLIQEELESCVIEKKNLRKNGSEIWVHLTSSLVRDDHGSPEYILGILKDISLRKSVEISLKKSRDEYRKLIDNLPQRIVMKDFQFKYTAVNRQFAADLNLTPEQIVGKADSDIFPKEVALRRRIDDEIVINTGQVLNSVEDIEIAGVRKKFETLKIPNRNDNNELEGILAISLDITEKLKAEAEKKKLAVMLQQSQKMEALGTLAGGIAHDFNNILHPIIGFSTLGTRASEKQTTIQTYFESINKAAKRAKDLVQQILTFSRQHDKALEPNQLQPIIKETLKMLRASLPVTIKISAEVNDNCKPVKADISQIHQILMNLTTNAYQAMLEKGGELRISLEPFELSKNSPPKGTLQPGEYVCLKVSDTGPGVPNQIKNRIFDPYFTTKDKDSGTGLGLSVVLGIVQSHNGHIEMVSIVGKGTEFSVYLPVTAESLNIKDEMVERSDLSGNEHILVVDDEQDIVFFLSEALMQYGYKITSETNSRAAWEKFQRDPLGYDLVLSDITMPELTGYQLSINMLELRPDLPIILCTGYNEGINEDKTSAIGVRLYLTKPIDQKELISSIRNVLDE